jgi:hypothetical protein
MNHRRSDLVFFSYGSVMCYDVCTKIRVGSEYNGNEINGSGILHQVIKCLL